MIMMTLPTGQVYDPTRFNTCSTNLWNDKNSEIQAPSFCTPARLIAQQIWSDQFLSVYPSIVQVSQWILKHQQPRAQHLDSSQWPHLYHTAPQASRLLS